MDKFIVRLNKKQPSGENKASVSSISDSTSGQNDSIPKRNEAENVNVNRHSLPSEVGPSSRSKADDSASAVSAPTDLAPYGENIKQIILSAYPKNNEKRSFNSSWFKIYEWLEYSVVKDAAFCYPCRHFQAESSVHKDSKFATDGYKTWRKALEKGLLLIFFGLIHTENYFIIIKKYNKNAIKFVIMFSIIICCIVLRKSIFE